MESRYYPSFGSLSIEDKPFFDKAFQNDPPQISEFTFTNLFAWREPYALSFCLLDGFCIVRSDATKEARFFPPIGSGQKAEAIARILEDSRGVCIRVPEELCAFCASAGRFECLLDEDNSDYVFSCLDLVNLPGRKYDGKRNLIKKFKSENAYQYEALQPSTVKECLSFQEFWCVIRECDTVESLANERKAITEMLEHFRALNLKGGVIRIKGEIHALALAEPLKPDTLVMHVLKANPRVAGLYQTITQEFLSHHCAGFTFVNFEQDLGVRGLRQGKRSYHPIHMVKKYTVRLKE